MYSSLAFQSTTFDFGGMMATRIFLGIFEAGFGPAIPLYFCMYLLGSFFSRSYSKSPSVVLHQARDGVAGMWFSIWNFTSESSNHYSAKMAYWFGFAAVAGAFGGIIAFGIQHANIDIERWRLLFIVEVGSRLHLPSLIIDIHM
jgi:hypothetical protein